MKKEIKVFVSPTCGPCQLFKPQLKQAATELEITYTEYDVTTKDGVEEAKKYGVTNSGQAIYFIDDEEKFRWITPCASSKVKEDINSIK